jgi:hypothetical protein
MGSAGWEAPAIGKLTSRGCEVTMRSTTLKPQSDLILRAAAYWVALILANAACLVLMGMLLFR